jgi:hypothetical protein
MRSPYTLHKIYLKCAACVVLRDTDAEMRPPSYWGGPRPVPVKHRQRCVKFGLEEVESSIQTRDTSHGWLALRQPVNTTRAKDMNATVTIYIFHEYRYYSSINV